MCGIVGLVEYDPEAAERRVIAGVEGLRHRGPDDQSFSRWGPVALGMARLAIRDPANGRQPMALGGMHLVFNGEIYNTGELIESQDRFKPSTTCDTEALLIALVIGGPRMLSRVEGMFALIAYDEVTNQIWLARDRFGQKPLYYSLNPDHRSAAFCSELLPMNQLMASAAGVSMQGMGETLRFQSSLGRRTTLAGVQRVLPGEIITIDVATLSIEAKMLGLESVACDVPPPLSLRQSIVADVESHLQADREVGLFLSGGIDSGLVALALGDLGVSLPAFTLASDDPSENEAAQARMMADRAGLHHVVVRMPRSLTVPELAELAVKVAGEPLGDPSILPTSWLSEAAVQEVAVVLTGDGGDELFGGYARYTSRMSTLLPAISRIHPSARLATLIGLLGQLPRDNARVAILAAIAEAIAQGESAYAGWVAQFSKVETERLLGCRLEASRLPDRPTWLPPGDAFSESMATDISWYLGEVVLAKVDRASMHHGLEARPPLLGRNTLGQACAYSWDQKIQGRRPKSLLRQLLAEWGQLPVHAMAPKRGFTATIRDRLNVEVNECVDYCCEAGIFDEGLVRAEFRRFADGQEWRERRCWSLLVASAWQHMVSAT